MRATLLAIAALCLLATALPTATAAPQPDLPDDDTCLPEAGTYLLPAGTESRGGSVWEFTGTEMVSPTEWAGQWVPVICVHP